MNMFTTSYSLMPKNGTATMHYKKDCTNLKKATHRIVEVDTESITKKWEICKNCRPNRGKRKYTKRSAQKPAQATVPFPGVTLFSEATETEKNTAKMLVYGAGDENHITLNDLIYVRATDIYAAILRELVVSRRSGQQSIRYEATVRGFTQRDLLLNDIVVSRLTTTELPEEIAPGTKIVIEVPE